MADDVETSETDPDVETTEIDTDSYSDPMNDPDTASTEEMAEQENSDDD